MLLDTRSDPKFLSYSAEADSNLWMSQTSHSVAHKPSLLPSKLEYVHDSNGGIGSLYT